MVEAKARPCLTRSATSLQSPRPSEKCALLRCRPGLTVPRWVASSVTRSARKVVALGEASTGISLARRGKFPIIRKCTMGGSSWLMPRCGRV
ncbi:hypothetical protein Lalb_Chr02g0155941 [Lupinus albus]|uniref:Uncharacterized protein n=1 Tax=Lupinus albus TaxID=3870 RepID=A0A6A4R0P5_LUPAL|nr:hypothetical protein Lalb_Chr02g0155941 [Lupinus albus]